MLAIGSKKDAAPAAPTKFENEVLAEVRAIAARLARLEELVRERGVDAAADRRKEFAERSVSYADQRGGTRAQRLAHALAAHRLMSDGQIGDNVARVEIEAVLARRKPPPAPGQGQKGVAP